MINFAAKGSSLSKGESLKDTALTLEAMGADAVVIRHPAAGRRTGSPTPAGSAPTWSTPATAPTSTPPRRCSTPSPCGATSAADGQRLDGRRVAIVGDVLHSRVARSNALLLRTLGAEVTLVSPPTLLPVGIDTWAVETSYDLDAVLPKADAVMMLRVQRERMHGGFFPTPRVLPPLRPRRSPDGDPPGPHHRDAPRPDGPRHGDHRRRRRLRPLR